MIEQASRAVYNSKLRSLGGRISQDETFSASTRAIYPNLELSNASISGEMDHDSESPRMFHGYMYIFILPTETILNGSEAGYFRMTSDASPVAVSHTY